MNVIIYYVIAFMALNAITAEAERVVCLYNSWSVYHPFAGKFEIEDIDPNLCTHAIYTAVGLKVDDVEIFQPRRDLPDYNGEDGFRRFNDLRKRNPNLKTMISLDDTGSSSKLSAMVSDPWARSRFVRNIVNFIIKYKFDGLNLVWIFPVPQREGDLLDLKNYVDLLKSLREALSRQDLLLSATINVPQTSAPISYDLANCFVYLNFINLITYQFNSREANTTGLNSPLYGGSGSGIQYSVDDAVKYFLNQGASPEKLNLGIAFHGRSFTLADPARNYVGAPTIGPGSIGPISSTPGVLGYNDICVLKKFLSWTVKYDERGSSSYGFWNDQWVSYDDSSAVSWKGNYIRAMNLGGGMVVNIDNDDFKGYCGPKYPLLRALGRKLGIAEAYKN